jgi:putative SbcD/Mre11-related phosphoesterase
LTPERAAIHEPTATAVIADLHLGYDQARCRGGDAVPTVRLDDLLAPLAAVLLTQEVHRLVIAGDLFEDAHCASLAAEFLDWLRLMGVELVGVVPGNHDRGLEGKDHRLPLQLEGVCLGSWRVVHGDKELPSGPLVLGHFHPCLRWNRRLMAPCYLVGPDRLVLPAFSADAAGVNVLTQARWRHYHAYAIAGDKVLAFGQLARLGKTRIGNRE